jgi:hypothetical protein
MDIGLESFRLMLPRFIVFSDHPRPSLYLLLLQNHVSLHLIRSVRSRCRLCLLLHPVDCFRVGHFQVVFDMLQGGFRAFLVNI